VPPGEVSTVPAPSGALGEAAAREAPAREGAGVAGAVPPAPAGGVSVGRGAAGPVLRDEGAGELAGGDPARAAWPASRASRARARFTAAAVSC
jgi:hypothetical protein